MKKCLLLCMAAAAGVSTAAAEGKTPFLVHDASFQRISADGRLAISEVYGDLKIYNVADGTLLKEFLADENWVDFYTIGNGNCLTADGGILVGSTTQMGNAAYLIGGEWRELSVQDEERVNLANGITPDGSRICGTIALNEMTFEDVIMQVPAYWDRDENGEGYGECHILPYPTKDLFGETPQYIMAVAIAADGKTIVGQMTFGNGGMVIPVVFKEDEKGEWSYTLPTKDLFNPDGIEPVENPGEGPTGPYYEEYMTQEEIDAYNIALSDYYQADPPGSLPYPEFEDYMSAESLAAYEAANEKYNEEYEAWLAKYEAYAEYLDAVTESSPSFVMNNVLLSTDGKYIVSTLEMPDPNADPWAWFPSVIYKPSTLNIETGELEVVDTDLSILASGVADNGVILAYNGQRSIPMLGYIIKDGNVQEIGEYIQSINPSYGEWIKDNMTHEVAVDYDPETWEEIYETVTFTGMPVASPDLSVITVWTTTPWDYNQSAEGVIFDMSGNVGVYSLGSDSKDLSVVDGKLLVPAGFASVEIYNISGICVKTLNDIEVAISLDLGSGTFIARGTRTDGTTSVLKIAK